MTSLLIDTLVAIVRHLIGAGLWGAIAGAVKAQDGQDLTGDEKRAAVIDTVRSLGLATTGWAVNLAIETAVTKLRAQQGDA